MALTRKLLKGMGLTDEQVDTIVEAHTETVDGLKNQMAQYKADAEKLPSVQQELNTLKQSGGDYKAKYDKEHADFEAYKNGILAKETKAAKEKAARDYFESKGIKGKSLDIAVRGSATEIDGLKLGKDGKIEDSATLDSLISGVYAGLVSTTETGGIKTPNPAGKTGEIKTRADVYKKDEHGRYVLSTAERQKALADIIQNEND